MYVIANGGMSSNNIRNTIDAVLLTKNASYVDGVLIDIRLTLDNEIVLMKHDNLEIDTLGKGNVSQMLYKDIKKVKFPSKIFKYYIPTLKEVLNLYICDKVIILNMHDAKDKNELFVKKVIDLIDNYPTYYFYLETDSKKLLDYLITDSKEHSIGYKMDNDLTKSNGDLAFCDVFYKVVNSNVNTYQKIMGHIINEIHEFDKFVKWIDKKYFNDLLIITDNPKRISEHINKVFFN